MEEERRALRIVVEGVVQGVGFRPFVYRLAREFGIRGVARNTKGAVEIEASGAWADLRRFIDGIERQPPPLAVIRRVRSEACPEPQNDAFVIAPSADTGTEGIFLSPDTATCAECEDDFAGDGRYGGYPFVTCTNCGPRFSIITGAPYDRRNTTMAVFPLCADCDAEYGDIGSRRYHAEPLSCARCGPRYALLDSMLRPVVAADPLHAVRELLGKGCIAAVKGIGGFHLMVDGTNAEAVSELRKRKRRDTKPFAVMFRDMDALTAWCETEDFSRSLLESGPRPIVLLRWRAGGVAGQGAVARETIAGTSPWCGAMLPYTPVHRFLTAETPVVVCTSGNVSGEPVAYRDDDLVRLRDIADCFLVHNREIVRFVEDSVVRTVTPPSGGEQRAPFALILRKSRGYAPQPLFLDRSSSVPVAALGGDLKSSISLLSGDRLIQSQYLGDLADALAYDDFRRCYDDLTNIFDIAPELLVADAHPAYLSAAFADEIAAGRPVLKVQHHRAHVASVALERGWFDDEIVGVAMDGTGYGDDGMIWGGEVFCGRLSEQFVRRGHLSYLPLPFGDSAVREPEKTAFSYLAAAGVDDPRITALFSDGMQRNAGRLKKYVAESPVSASSAGRLFDAVSFLLGFRRATGYEGEAAVELEHCIYRRYGAGDRGEAYDWALVRKNDVSIIDSRGILAAVIADMLEGTDAPTIALRFHRTILDAFMAVVSRLSTERGTKKIALSGGCFQNAWLLGRFIESLADGGYDWAVNRYCPPNDACVSVGQCAIAAFSQNDRKGR